ncbi:MAG: filamentous hemagglutinin N-terminal domain-containing protein [Leptolyngbya sp. SIOISBB]|nr:filamentous hemagglutinin N-terminal domain-containing protein [Leptolyngbya sp. SIOISBB]
MCYRFTYLTVLSACLLTWSIAQPAVAQSITGAADGVGTDVTFDAASQTYTINGGTQVEANLFHSFQQFGLSTNEIANFLANPDVANILARVSGGQTSVINGLLEVSGGNNANLFILNPAGVLLGRNANLNLSGSFSVSTASGLAFGDNVFNAIGSNDYSALTGNPTGYVFLGNEGGLLNEADLAVNPDESLTLVGNTVINTGDLEAPGGNVSIVAVPEQGILRISQDGLVMSLAVSTDQLQGLVDAGITPLDLPGLLAGEWGGDATTVTTLADGTVVFAGEKSPVDVAAGSVTSIGTVDVSGQQGGQVVFQADDVALPSGLIDVSGTEQGGELAVYARDDLRLGVTVDASGVGGHILLDPATLDVDAAAAATVVSGLNTGDVTLEASETINVNAAIDSSAQGNNHTLTLADENSDNNLAINLNALISLGANQTLTGDGTTVHVNVTDAGIVQNGVDVAAANGTVNLAAGTFQEGQEVTISRPVTLRGAGQTNTFVDGAGTHRVLNNTSGNMLTLADLTVQNGSTTGNGGGFSSNGAVTLNNATVSGNSAGDRGGGIYTPGAVTLNHATVSGNSSNDRGGGIYGRNGLITMTNSTVSGNSSNQYGGGIASRNAITVTNSTVSGNSSRRNGGGLYSRSGNITVTNSTVSGNSSNRHTGGIWARSRTITLTDSTVSGNSARVSAAGTYSQHITVTNSTISGNSAGDLGGGLYATVSTTVRNSTITGNSSRNKGGGIYHRNRLTMENSTVSGNSSNRGGGIYSRGGGAVTLTNSTVSGNSVSDRGGGIFMRNNGGGNLILSNATIAANTANRDGGGIFFNTASNNTINNSIVANNVAGRDGPDINGNLVNSTITSSLIQDTTGITAGAPSHGVNGNVVGHDPLLTPLAHNGGPTLTHGLAIGSPAIDASGAGATTTDQRVLAAVNIRDMGAFEFAAEPDFTIIAGNHQSTTVDTAFSTALQVQLRDANGDPFWLGSDIIFTAPSSGASLSSTHQTVTPGVDGIASLTTAANTVAGTFTVSAGVTGQTGVNFDLVNTAGAASILNIIRGNRQNTIVNTAFSDALQVQVTDAFGNAVSGVNVTLTAPLTGASANLAGLSLTTDAFGQASTTAIANATAGRFQIGASVLGLTGVSFDLTNTALVIPPPPVDGAPSAVDPDTLPGGAQRDRLLETAEAAGYQRISGDEVLGTCRLTVDPALIATLNRPDSIRQQSEQDTGEDPPSTTLPFCPRIGDSENLDALSSVD